MFVLYCVILGATTMYNADLLMHLQCLKCTFYKKKLVQGNRKQCERKESWV